MRVSLRNLAICGSLAVAGMAMAQTTPKVTMEWNKFITKDQHCQSTDCRDGSGYGNKIYWSNKADHNVYCYDPTDESVTVVANVSGSSLGISLDDAGNILVNGGWAGANSSKLFNIISAADKTVTTFEANLHDVAYGRNDFLPRVVGNMLSEDGAIFYLFPNLATSTAMIYVQNGAQADGPFSFFNSEVVPKTTGDATSLAQPAYTFAELIQMGDDAINGAAVRRRGNKYIYVFNYGSTAWEAVPQATSPAPSTDNGFDVFSLADKKYQVYPTLTGAGSYNSTIAIADFEGNVIYEDERGNLHTAGSSTNSGSITARKVDEHTVEVYTYYPVPTGAYVAKFKVSDKDDAVNSIVADQAEGKAVYYNLQGVKVAGNPANGVYLKVVNGKASKVLVK